MSPFQQPASARQFSATATPDRLLLFCRFDYRQKAWRLSAFGIPDGRDCAFPGGLAALTSEISRNLSNFSAPSFEGTKPANPAVSRPPANGAKSPSVTAKSAKKN